MAEPNLNAAAEPKSWYRGLTRYQWWVLIIASLGWMFDTMDQQFFNLARGPALQDILQYDPAKAGAKRLGKGAPDVYGVSDLDAIVAAGLLKSEQKDKLLVDADGKLRPRVVRAEVAMAVGENIVGPRFLEMGGRRLQEQGVVREVYDEAGLRELVGKHIISAETASKKLAKYPEGVIPREYVARHIGQEMAKNEVSESGATATLIFVMGWAIGGLIFGWIGDALGRAKTMALTILCYALFTGLSGLATTELEFFVYRFLTALGVGGEFAAGAALVAETMPDRSRPAALGTLQALSAFGNMTASILALFIMPTLGWRWLFAVGALPGILAIFVFIALKEPEKWRQARAKWLDDKARGVAKGASYVGLFEDARWRKRAIVGMLLGVVGVGGLWGVGFFTPELTRTLCQGMSDVQKEKYVAITFFLQQLGAFFGIGAYTVLSLRVGRKPAFAFFFIIAFIVVSYTFLFANTIVDAFILLPLVGFVTLGPFGGFAIYFPELFPTRLRATGTGFCYNVGRFLAALVPQMKSGLQGMFMSGAIMLPLLPSAVGNAELAIRYGSFLIIFIYLLGLVVLLFAPETKGQPLPED
ncbi:MAG TPA: MFS transporter [Phycisphaerae bacterium]|nr:MFS transporter [Phycisphaerae bacterium]